MRTTTINVTACSHEWCVEGHYVKASKGRREFGVPMEPDEPAGFEIERVTLPNSDVDLLWALTPTVVELIQEQADESGRVDPTDGPEKESCK